jgi:UDP-2-acetamido-2,6-beta-L-arabino-hexul-4-ose reductase
VDIPTGHTHNITNIGDTDSVTVMWASELFDPNRPDTFFEEVEINGK